jgi:hypothetical protein
MKNRRTGLDASEKAPWNHYIVFFWQISMFGVLVRDERDWQLCVAMAVRFCSYEWRVHPWWD